MRRTYRVALPRTVDHAGLLAFVRALSGLPQPGAFTPVHAVALETYADASGIRHYLSLPGHVQEAVDSWLTTHLPGASLEPVVADADHVAHQDWTGVELTLSDHRRLLKIDSPRAVAATLLSGFSTLHDGDALVLQWLVCPAVPRPATDAEPGKTDDATFNAIARIGAVGAHRQRLIRDVAAGLSLTHRFGVRFRKRLVPQVGTRIRRRTGTLAYPIYLNAMELSCVLGWPFGAPNIAGLGACPARQLAPDNMIDRTGLVLGVSDFPRLRGRPLALPHAALTVHTWICGPSGSGKSALLHNIAAQTMAAGLGLVLIEPKGDLARAVLASCRATAWGT